MRREADRRFWKRPQMARRLLPVIAQPLTPSHTPAEYVREMSAATLRMTGKARETAVDAVALARSACDAITDLDHELAANREAVEAPRLEEIRGRREVLATGLKMLWQHHMTLERDQTDAAIQGVTIHSASFVAAISGGPAEPGESEAPTFAATGTQLTAQRPRQ